MVFVGRLINVLSVLHHKGFNAGRAACSNIPLHFAWLLDWSMQQRDKDMNALMSDILGFWKYCRVSEPTRIQMCPVIYLHINKHHNWAHKWTKMVKISYLDVIKVDQNTMNTHWTLIIFKNASLDRSEVNTEHTLFSIFFLNGWLIKDTTYI